MDYLWGTALLVLVAVGVHVVWQERHARRAFAEVGWPVYAKKVLTLPEQILYFRLLAALPDYVTLLQVEMTRIIGFKRGARRRFVNALRGKSLGFVICNKDGSVRAVIELDDTAQLTDGRQRSDTTKSTALNSAGIPLIRWNVSALPSVEAIRAAVNGGGVTLK